MAHIALPDEDLPGIRGLMNFRPETAVPLNDLAQALLQSDEGLSKAERERIATRVSVLNDCTYCQNIHGAIALAHLKGDSDLVQQVKTDFENAGLSEKMKALLHIASSVQEGGKVVTEEQIELAKNAGASDLEIHDTVLIAAAFCMYNRYVDGLGTWAPAKPEDYIKSGEERARVGYGTRKFTWS